MTRAGELANDLAHQLVVTEAERDELKLLLDEAQAVIDAVRGIVAQYDQRGATWCMHRLDEVDGL